MMVRLATTTTMTTTATVGKRFVVLPQNKTISGSFRPYHSTGIPSKMFHKTKNWMIPKTQQHFDTVHRSLQKENIISINRRGGGWFGHRLLSTPTIGIRLQSPHQIMRNNMSSLAVPKGFAMTRNSCLGMPHNTKLPHNSWGIQLRFIRTAKKSKGKKKLKMKRKSTTITGGVGKNGRKLQKKNNIQKMNLSQKKSPTVLHNLGLRKRKEKIATQKYLSHKRITTRKTLKKSSLASSSFSSHFREGHSRNKDRRLDRIQKNISTRLSNLPRPSMPQITRPQISPSDLFIMTSAILLLIALVFTPYAASHVFKSEKEDAEFLEWDDPVAQTVQSFRDFFKRDDVFEQVLDYLQSHQAYEDDDDTEEGRESNRERTRFMERIVVELLESTAVQEAASNFVARVVESQRIQDGVIRILQTFWYDLINDPETLAQVIQLLNNAIQSEAIQKSVQALVKQLINDKEVYSELEQLVVRLGNEQQIHAATQQLLTESAHKTLNDPEILDHSMAFATDVVGDDVVQRTSGEALRNTVSYAIRPSLSAFLVVAGVGLIFFSFSAFRTSRFSEEEAKVVDRALSSMAESIQTSASSGFYAVVSLPGRFISACISAVASVLKAPLVAIQRTGAGLGRARHAASEVTSSLFASILALPGKTFQNVLLSLGSARRSVSSKFMDMVSQAGSHISTSTIVVSWKGFIAGSKNTLSAAGQSVLRALGRCSSAATNSIRSAGAYFMEVGSSAPLAAVYVDHKFTEFLVKRTNVLKGAFKSISAWCMRFIQRDQDTAKPSNSL